MNISDIRLFFEYGTMINFAFFFLYTVIMRFGKEIVLKYHGRWSGVSPEKFYAIQYQVLQFYKMFILFFNVVPWLALGMMR